MSSHLPKTSLRDKSRHDAGARSRRLRALLLATSALASVALTTAARGADAGWRDDAGSGDFNDRNNWRENRVPDGQAFFGFGSSAHQDIAFSADTIVGEIAVANGFNYTFSNELNTTVAIMGRGFILTEGSNATFTNGKAGSQDASVLNFKNNATAANISLINFKTANFFDQSSAGSANITNQAGGLFRFWGSSTAANASLNNFGTVEFRDTSTAGTAVIGNSVGGRVNFRGGASADHAFISSSGVVAFFDDSKAGFATITNNSSGGANVVAFRDRASADNSLIINSAIIQFFDHSTAGAATIENHSSLVFAGSSDAGSATITSDGRVFFANQANGGTASLNMTGGSSVLDISDLGNDGSGALGTRIGSLEGTGKVFLGSKNLAVGGNNKNLATFSGVIQDGGELGGAGGSLTKEGTGSLNLSGVNTYTGATLVKDGVLGIGDHGSIARSSGVTVEKVGTLVFSGDGEVGNLAIANHGRLWFVNASHADSAFITSDGAISFENTASGGTARIALEQGGTLDISNLASGTTVGSIESKDGNGNVFLGGNNLAVGGNGRSTTFAGVIQDGGDSGVVGGALTKEGTGALTLTGVNTYTGQTRVTGGALIVDGSISSGVSVEAGGTLAGTGTVSSTFVNDGGTLVAGHSDAPFGALKVQGDLGFSKGATYSVQVSPDAAGATSVKGTATLGGATVAANFAKGSYVTKQYGILDAGSISGSFGQLVSTNLLPIFSASLTQDANHVFLNVSTIGNGGGGNNGGGSNNGGGGSSGGGGGSNGGDRGGGPGGDPLAGYNANQRNVINGFRNSFNLVGGLSGVYATLTSPAGLTQVSGETAVGSQQATFDAMGQFMGVMLDPAMAGRGDSPRNAMASMPRKAPVVEDFSSRWAVWAAGFGGSQNVNGDAALGSNKTTSGVYGSAVGADYRLSPNTVAGFALAGGGTSFRVANGGSGNSDLFQAGGYLRHTQGAAFIAAALAYGWQDVTTNRTVTAAGFDNLRGRFNANALSGRLEGGYRIAGAAMDVTPYAAGQFISYRLPSYAEQVVSGANTYALAYGGKDVTASRTELGARTEKSFAQENDSMLTLRGRLAWAHDFNTDRNVQAVFVSLPGSAFMVNGAQAAANTALASLSAEFAWRSGWAASATFDGQFSDTTKSYAGKGVVRYAW